MYDKIKFQTILTNSGKELVFFVVKSCGGCHTLPIDRAIETTWVRPERRHMARYIGKAGTADEEKPEEPEIEARREKPRLSFSQECCAAAAP